MDRDRDTIKESRGARDLAPLEDSSQPEPSRERQLFEEASHQPPEASLLQAGQSPTSPMTEKPPEEASGNIEGERPQAVKELLSQAGSAQAAQLVLEKGYDRTINPSTLEEALARSKQPKP